MTSGSAPRLAATTGTPSRHRFEHRDAEAFLERRLHEADRAFDTAPAGSRDRRSRCASRGRSSGGAAIRSSQGRAASVAWPASTSSGTIAPSRRQPLVRVEQAADVLARLERAEEQHVARRGRPLARRPVRRAGRADRDPIGAARRSCRSTSPAVNCETTMIAIGPVRVRARQRRVVAADLGAGALGMREEIQIVNRDDLRRVARRQQQRMQRVRDVERPPRERFGRRPVEAVPREIQERAPERADRRRAAPRSPSSDGQAILPRAREERQRRAAAAASRRGATSARDELMRVFADAAAFAQRRTVVDQDAHLFKSFRVSILL